MRRVRETYIRVSCARDVACISSADRKKGRHRGHLRQAYKWHTRSLEVQEGSQDEFFGGLHNGHSRLFKYVRVCSCAW